MKMTGLPLVLPIVLGGYRGHKLQLEDVQIERDLRFFKGPQSKKLN